MQSTRHFFPNFAPGDRIDFSRCFHASSACRIIPSLQPMRAKLRKDMLREQGIYYRIWKKYLPVIRLFLKRCETGRQVIQLNKLDFESTGDRARTGYSFYLELKKAKAMNNIGSMAIARDLQHMLSEDETVTAFLKLAHVKISMGKNFELSFLKMGDIIDPNKGTVDSEKANSEQETANSEELPETEDITAETEELDAETDEADAETEDASAETDEGNNDPTSLSSDK